MLFQWRQLPILHDGDAKVTIIPRWNVEYNFFEQPEEMGKYGIIDRVYDSMFTSTPDLSASWEAHRAQRLARAQ